MGPVYFTRAYFCFMAFVQVRRAEKLMKETIRYGMKYEIWALKVRPLFEGNRIHWNFINFCYDDKVNFVSFFLNLFGIVGI